MKQDKCKEEREIGIMNEIEKVSIIVAIYKSEKFLDKLINSIINQTYKNIEIILVDDGSPDNSGKICDEYAKKDSRIKVIHKKNGGTCEARNYGLENATGKYVTIVDGDDWLSKDFVEYMMKIIKETNAEMAMSYNVFTTRDQVQIKNDKIEKWSPEDATATLIYPYMKLGPWNKIYSMKLLKDNNITFSVPWFGEGLYFSTKAAQYSNCVGVGYRKVYNYRLNNAESGLTQYKVQKGINARNNINTIKKELHINTPKVRNAIEWHIWKNYTFILLQIIGTNSKEEYKDEYKRCIKYIRLKMPKVLIKSKINLREKLKIIACGIFPVQYTKLVIKKSKKALLKDKME